MNKYVDVHPQCMGAYPPLGCESSPPPSKKIIVISNPLLRKYGFLRTEYNMIQKMLGLDVFSFYEIMIRHEWIQEFWFGGGVGFLPQEILKCQMLSDEFRSIFRS